MNTFKYIIIEKNFTKIPIIFSVLLQHDEVGFNKNVLSAGFVSFDVDEKFNIQCWGKSVSLGVSSCGLEDAYTILKQYEFGSSL
jgi:hypothetical protein